jgi:hypothetical protein
MLVIRETFYKGNQAWFKDQHFIRQRVVTYPAQWLDSRGVTLQPERYKEVLLEIIRTIKLNGNTETVVYWPRYLLHCVQQYLKHHGEELYEEGKSIRSAVDLAMTHVSNSQRAQPDVVSGIAQVHRALTAVKSGRKKSSSVKSSQQMDLL